MIFSLQELDRNKITSESLKEYLSFKDNNIDYVILFQIGNFYETFFEDAKILSNLTGLTLGSRNFKDTGNVAQCGFNISNDILLLGTRNAIVSKGYLNDSFFLNINVTAPGQYLLTSSKVLSFTISIYSFI